MLTTILRQPFRYLWAASELSAMGDSAFSVALLYVLAGLPSGGIAIGVVGLAGSVPAMLFSSVAGILADRWSAKNILITSDIVRMLVLFPLLLPASDHSLVTIAGVVFVGSAVSQFFNVASNTAIPRWVPLDELMTSNASLMIARDSARVLGPLIGGLLVKQYGFSWVVCADMVSFAGSALFTTGMPALSRISSTDVHPTARPRHSSEFMKYMRATSWYRAILMVAAIDGLSRGIQSIFIVLFLRDVRHYGLVLYGLMNAAQALGSFGASAYWGNRSSVLRRLVIFGGVLSGAALILALCSKSIVVDVTSWTAFGFWVSTSYLGQRVLLQEHLPLAMRGRLIGFSRSINGVLLVVGRVTGMIASLDVSATAALWCCAILWTTSSIAATNISNPPTTRHISLHDGT